MAIFTDADLISGGEATMPAPSLFTDSDVVTPSGQTFTDEDVQGLGNGLKVAPRQKAKVPKGQLPEGLAFSHLDDVRDWKPSKGFQDTKELAFWLKLKEDLPKLGKAKKGFETLDEFNQWLRTPRSVKPTAPKPGELRLGTTLDEARKQTKPVIAESGPRRGVPIIKKPVSIGTGAQLRQQAAGFEVNPELEGLDVTMVDGKPEVIGVKRKEGEGVNEFLLREATFRGEQQAREKSDRAMRAGVRAENLAKAGDQEADPEKYLTAVAQGMGSSIRSTGVGLGLLAGRTGEEMEADPALANPMPRLNAQESQEWAVKRATGIGGALPMLAVGALPGGHVVNALAGMAQMGGQTYEQARAVGQSHDEALASAVAGALPGMLQGFGVGSGKFFGNVAKGTIGSTVKGLGEQVGVGLTQKVLDNVNAKVASGYDPKRAVTDGLWEAVQDAAVIGGLAHGSGLVKGGLERSGIEASFGELADEHARQAGTELYAGIDPALVRDYLPRPETIRGMFKSIFGNKVAPSAEVSERLDRSKDQMWQQIDAARDAKLLEVPQYPKFTEADPEHIKAVLNRPELEKVWGNNWPSEKLSEPETAQYYEKKYVLNDQGMANLVVSRKSDGQEVFNEPVVGMGGEILDKAALATAIDAQSQGINTPLTKLLHHTYEQLRGIGDTEARNTLYKDSQVAKKHAARWLDKQKWLVQQQARKEAGPGMASRLGDEPQGIVVHNISPRNLSKLLEAAGGDISKASQPMPSIGVIHPETNFDSFGGVTLIGTPSLIESAVESGTAYPTDFYTPTVSDALHRVQAGGKVTPETAAMIVEEMKRQTNSQMEERLADPNHVFTNGAVFNTYAKAGGGFESIEAVRKGLAMLTKAGKTDGSDVPEFEGMKDTQKGFNGARQELRNALEQLGAHPSAKSLYEGNLPKDWSLIDHEGKGLEEDFTILDEDGGLPEDMDAWSTTMNKIKEDPRKALSQTIDQYLLTQLAKEELPSKAQLEVGIGKLIESAGLTIQDKPNVSKKEYEIYNKLGGLLGKGESYEAALKDANDLIETEDLQGNAKAIGETSVRDINSEPSLKQVIKELAEQAANAFETFRKSPTIYMEAQPAREVKLDEYVAALVPHANETTWQANPSNSPKAVDRVADQLAQQGIKVYRYSSPEEKVAIQKALAQFKDLAVDPNSKYGALYSNPVFDPEAWKKAAQAWATKVDPGEDLLQRTRHLDKISDINNGPPLFAVRAIASPHLEEFLAKGDDTGVSLGVTTPDKLSSLGIYGDVFLVAKPEVLDSQATTYMSDAMTRGRNRAKGEGELPDEGHERYRRLYDSPGTLLDLNHTWAWLGGPDYSAKAVAKRKAKVRLQAGEPQDVEKLGAKQKELSDAVNRMSKLLAGKRKEGGVDFRSYEETQGSILRSLLPFVYQERPLAGSEKALLKVIIKQTLKAKDSMGISLQPDVTHEEALKATSEVLSRAEEYRKIIRGEAEGYLETKMHRQVAPEDFNMALVPVDTPSDVVERLRARGLDVKIYSKPEELSGLVQEGKGELPGSRQGWTSWTGGVFDPEAWKAAMAAWKGEPQAEKASEIGLESERLPEGQAVPTVDPKLDSALPAAEVPPVETVPQSVPPSEPPPPSDIPPGTPAQPDPLPPNLYQEVLTSDAVKDISSRVGRAMEAIGLKGDPLLPPYLQIAKLSKEHPELLKDGRLAEAMAQAGVTGEEIIKSFSESVSNAGRTMQAVQAADAFWDTVIKADPQGAVQAAKSGLGPRPEKVIKAALEDLQAGVLGRSMWRRSGDLLRKMYLTRFSTASNNAVGTLPRMPLDLVDGLMTGAAMGALQPAKWAGASDASKGQGAAAGAVAGAQAAMKVAMAFPGAARKLLRRGPGASEQFNEQVIGQMEALHPDLHSKLHGLSSGIELAGKTKFSLEAIKDLLPYLNDGEKYKKYEAELALLQKRYDANESGLGKAFSKTNWVYDQFLKPGNVQEFFFRRPYFVGSLARRAREAGFDLNELAATNRLSELPKEAWEGAADDALTFTYAYAPHRQGHGHVEKFASSYISMMDALGPIGAVVDAFPKAMYNGLKFAYEYSPLGAMKPLANIAGDAREGGRDAIKYDDVSRVSKAALGIAMFGTAWMLRREAGGDEWWQLKTGLKDKKGQPIYFNAKKLMPFAGFLYLADVVQRAKDGRLTDRKPGDDLAELYLNARRSDQGGAVFSELLKGTANYWGSGEPLDERLRNKALKPVGEVLGAPLTPFINLRDLMGQFHEDEAVRRDTQESPVLGPAMDKLPWVRDRLPLYQPPTESAPRAGSAAPLLSEAGIALDPGSHFVTREFARLGLSPTHWLARDADSVINKAQYASYAELLGELGRQLERDPSYVKASTAEKLARLEEEIAGSPGVKGLAQLAREDGLAANSDEVERRKLLKLEKPFAGKASGLAKEVEEMRKAGKATKKP